jgi:hypothetical protein
MLLEFSCSNAEQSVGVQTAVQSKGFLAYLKMQTDSIRVLLLPNLKGIYRFEQRKVFRENSKNKNN